MFSRLFLEAGVAGCRWSFVPFSGWAEDFREDGFQGIGPYLVGFDSRMQFISVHHSFEQMAFRIREFRVDVEVANGFAIGDMGEVLVDLINKGNDCEVIVSGENCSGNDGRTWGLFATESEQRLQAAGNVLYLIGATGLGAHVVNAGEEDDDLWVYTIEFAMLQAPEDVLDSIGAPTEIGGVPPEEIGSPVFPQGSVLGVGGSPTARDGVAEEIDIDSALVRFLEELLVSDKGIAVCTGSGLSGRGDMIGSGAGLSGGAAFARHRQADQ